MIIWFLIYECRAETLSLCILFNLLNWVPCIDASKSNINSDAITLWEFYWSFFFLLSWVLFIYVFFGFKLFLGFLVLHTTISLWQDSFCKKRIQFLQNHIIFQLKQIEFFQGIIWIELLQNSWCQTKGLSLAYLAVLLFFRYEIYIFVIVWVYNLYALTIPFFPLI